MHLRAVILETYIQHLSPISRNLRNSYPGLPTEEFFPFRKINAILSLHGISTPLPDILGNLPRKSIVSEDYIR